MSSKATAEIARDIGARIGLIRGHRVLLDSDLASLYGVTTKRLNQQVRRNTGRFPIDFAFQLSLEEADSLRLQNATLKAAIAIDLAAANDYVARHGSFADLAREHYAGADDDAI